jgi:hypothetical protein
LVGCSAFLDEDLHEGPNFWRALPRKAALASRQLDRDIADPLGLAGLEHHVLREVVAFVKQADRRHPVFDRTAVFTFDHFARNALAGGLLGHLGGGSIGAPPALAGGQRQRREQQERGSAHQASGDHAS